VNQRNSCEAIYHSVSEDIYHIYGIRKIMTALTTARIDMSYHFFIHSIPVSAETMWLTRPVRKVSSHFEYLENWQSDLYV